MDNREAALRFFEYLRAMIMSTVKNPNDDGEMKEAEYLANYIKEVVADALEKHDEGKIPILNLTVSGSRDGETEARFHIVKNIGIVEAWKLKSLLHMINDKIEDWSKSLGNEDSAEDLIEYSALKKHIKGD